MNGHGTAETLAFAMLRLAERWGQEIGDREVAPVFLLGAGVGSGATELAARAVTKVASDAAIDRRLVETFARQLQLAAGGAALAESRTTASKSGRKGLADVAVAQAQFLRTLWKTHSGAAERGAWGVCCSDLAGDHALYLKVIFPRAKFVFLHRNPLEIFRSALRASRFCDAVEQRDISWAESFAEQWCSLVASFELWHKELDGIILSYEHAGCAADETLTAYLGEVFCDVLNDDAISVDPAGLPKLHDEEIALISERTGEIAARYGYNLAARPRRGASDLLQPVEASEVRAMHSENRRVSCAVLVPAMRYIEPECDEALAELEHRGYKVIRMRGCPSIDQGRNRLATLAVEHGFDETVWVDADTGFDPDAVERLRSHHLPIVTAFCAKKHPGGGLAVAQMPGTRELVMGEGGGLTEVLYAGTGFTLVRREVYVTIQGRFKLPLCDADRPHRAVPFFMPMLEDWGGRMSYLGEDYAFSRRARLCGYKIMADTSIRLWHIGMYRYGYEDAGNEIERLPTYRHVFESGDRRGG